MFASLSVCQVMKLSLQVRFQCQCPGKFMGGYAGLATGLAFATEYQGEATPHGHGFVSLANMYCW